MAKSAKKKLMPMKKKLQNKNLYQHNLLKNYIDKPSRPRINISYFKKHIKLFLLRKADACTTRLKNIIRQKSIMANIRDAADKKLKLYEKKLLNYNKKEILASWNEKFNCWKKLIYYGMLYVLWYTIFIVMELLLFSPIIIMYVLLYYGIIYVIQHVLMYYGISYVI